MSQLSSLSIQLVLIIEISQQLTFNIKKTKFLKVYLFSKCCLIPHRCRNVIVFFSSQKKCFILIFSSFPLGQVF